MTTKIKTHVLLTSSVFLKGHPKEGQRTFFRDKITNVLYDCESRIESYDEKGNQNIIVVRERKLHTIRVNPEYWIPKIKEVAEGKAVLSLREWSGKPYRSKQIEYARITKDNCPGVQILIFLESQLSYPAILKDGRKYPIPVTELATNDGLSLHHFGSWFKSYDLSKPLAIIHFTKFRY